MYTFLKEKVDISKIIKDLGNSFGGSNEDQMRGVTLLKGLATSDDPKANEFMKALDKWTTQQSKKMSESKVIEIQDEIKIVQDGKDLILEKGDKIKILETMGSLGYKYVDDDGNTWSEIERDGFTIFLSQIDSTHFKMLSDPVNMGFRKVLSKGNFSVWHIAQFRDEEKFYHDLQLWTSGREEIAGKIFE
jgi:hypothetical protein